jgi:hypothetical protein
MCRSDTRYARAGEDVRRGGIHPSGPPGRPVWHVAHGVFWTGAVCVRKGQEAGERCARPGPPTITRRRPLATPVHTASQAETSLPNAPP